MPASCKTPERAPPGKPNRRAGSKRWIPISNSGYFPAGTRRCRPAVPFYDSARPKTAPGPGGKQVSVRPSHRRLFWPGQSQLPYNRHRFALHRSRRYGPLWPATIGNATKPRRQNLHSRNLPGAPISHQAPISVGFIFHRGPKGEAGSRVCPGFLMGRVDGIWPSAERLTASYLQRIRAVPDLGPVSGPGSQRGQLRVQF